MKSFSVFTWLLALSVLAGCYIQKQDSGDDGGGGGSADVAFDPDVIAVFDASCATTSCHAGDLAAGGLNLSVADSDADTVYDAVQGVINIDDPESSLLLQKATAQTTHGGGTIFATTDEEYELLLSWIEAGALR